MICENYSELIIEKTKKNEFKEVGFFKINYLKSLESCKKAYAKAVDQTKIPAKKEARMERLHQLQLEINTLQEANTKEGLISSFEDSLLKDSSSSIILSEDKDNIEKVKSGCAVFNGKSQNTINAYFISYNKNKPATEKVELPLNKGKIHSSKNKRKKERYCSKSTYCNLF